MAGDGSTSGAGPGRQRSRWMTFDFLSIITLTILLVVFLSVFRDEYAQEALRFWVIGYGLGCLVFTYQRSWQSYGPPRVISTVSPGSEVGELQTGWRQRFGYLTLHGILQFWLWRVLDNFFALWLGVGLGIACTSLLTGQTPHLNWLCTVILVITCFRFILSSTTVFKSVILVYRGIIRVLLRKIQQFLDPVIF